MPKKAILLVAVVVAIAVVGIVVLNGRRAPEPVAPMPSAGVREVREPERLPAPPPPPPASEPKPAPEPLPEPAPPETPAVEPVMPEPVAAPALPAPVPVPEPAPAAPSAPAAIPATGEDRLVGTEWSGVPSAETPIQMRVEFVDKGTLAATLISTYALTGNQLSISVQQGQAFEGRCNENLISINGADYKRVSEAPPSPTTDANWLAGSEWQEEPEGPSRLRFGSSGECEIVFRIPYVMSGNQIAVSLFGQAHVGEFNDSEIRMGDGVLRRTR